VVDGRTPRLLYVFDGLGAGGHVPAPLARLPENRRFFAMVADTLRKVTQYAGPGAGRWLPADAQPGRWWEDLTSGTALRHSLLSGLAVHVHQLCLLQPGRHGDAPAPGEPVATAGHSLGIFAAIVAALRLRSPRRYLEVCEQSIAFVALQLIRAHEATAPDVVGDGLLAAYRSRAGDGAPPGPMAAVNGLSLATLRERVRRHPRQAGGGVEIGVVNAPTAHVLTGRTSALVRFWLAEEAWLRGQGGTWSFLANTAPFHNGALAPAVAGVDGDRDFIGYGVTGGELTVPVHTGGVPGNLQHSTDVFRDACEQLLLRPLDWAATVRDAVERCRPDMVIDYGPGLSAGVFARACLRRHGHPARVSTVPVAVPALR
jgi:malonyl CoA-acyl carrier protein transacylase